MLTQIHIQNFKGFKDTPIAPLRRVNLILGGQNVGKTSLLEAVYFGATAMGDLRRLPTVFRTAEGHDIERFLGNVLKDVDSVISLSSDRKIKITTCVNAGRTSAALGSSIGGISADGIGVQQYASNDGNALEVAALGGNAFSLRKATGFADPLALSVNLPDQKNSIQLFDRVVIARKKKQLIEMLGGIEPRLVDMHSSSPDGEQRIYIELEGHAQALPLPQLGHGFNRLVYLYCNLLATEATLALIDEVENGIHYSSLPTLFQGIQDIAVNHGVQTLMTTHSWDCIRAAYKTFADAGALQDFQLIRLEPDGDNVRAIVINDEALDTVMEAGYEVR